jgi:hypothetical protein
MGVHVTVYLHNFEKFVFQDFKLITLCQSYLYCILCSDDGPVPYGNIMFDRRVVRGSTYAQPPMPVSTHTITFTSALPNKVTNRVPTSLNLRTSISRISLSRGRAYNGSGIAVQ